MSTVLTGGLGLHNKTSYMPYTPFTEQDKKDPTFKYFIDKGMELPNTSLSSEDITDEKNNTKKKVSDYPKDIQEKYQQIHKDLLKKELSDVIKNNYVYVKSYKDANGQTINTVAFKKQDSKAKKTEIKNLDKTELAQVLSLAQGQATKEAKAKVFNQK